MQPAQVTEDARRSLKLSLSYAGIILATTALQSIYNTYYVEVFVQANGLAAGAFVFGQFIFGIWNCFNDPLFGMISDWLQEKGLPRHRQMLFGTPLYVLSFMIPWWKLPAALHSSVVVQCLYFITSLFFWDGGMTWVLISHSALLPEIAISGKERGKLSAFVSLATLLGGIALFPTYLFYDRNNLYPFRMYCIGVSAFCAVVFIVSSFGLGLYSAPTAPLRRYSKVNQEEEGAEHEADGLLNDQDNVELEDKPASNSSEEKSPKKKTSLPALAAPPSPVVQLAASSSEDTIRIPSKHDLIEANNALQEDEKSDSEDHVQVDIPTEANQFSAIRAIWVFMKQMLSNSNFVILIFINFSHLYMVATVDSYKLGYMEDTIQPSVESMFNMNADVAKSVVSTYFTLIAILPNLMGLITSTMSMYYESYTILMSLFVVRFLASVIAILIGYFVEQKITSIAFLLVLVITVGGVGRLLEQSMADFVDEDRIFHRRKISLASSIYGFNNLLTKPSQSIAPSVGLYILQPFGFVAEDDVPDQPGQISGEASMKPSPEHPQLGTALFYLMVISNLVCAAVQVVVWIRYDLHSEKLEEIKEQIAQKYETEDGEEDTDFKGPSSPLIESLPESEEANKEQVTIVTDPVSVPAETVPETSQPSRQMQGEEQTIVLSPKEPVQQQQDIAEPTAPAEANSS